MAQFTTVDNRGRGAAIERRRLRLGIDSIHAFADATGKDRGALTRAESGTASERTYKFLEAWLDAREHENSSERDDAGLDAPEPVRAAPGIVTIEMHGVFGIENVTFSGPADQADEVSRLAAEFMRNARDRADNAS
jgi:transcriptional regulator with XRE-family HTH domain